VQALHNSFVKIVEVGVFVVRTADNYLAWDDMDLLKSLRGLLFDGHPLESRSRESRVGDDEILGKPHRSFIHSGVFPFVYW
jgi:hypothetical protein